MVRSCEISIFRAILSLQIFIFVILEYIIFLESMRFWAHGGSTAGGEASPSSKKLIMGNPEIWLDFSLSFLDEFL